MAAKRATCSCCGRPNQAIAQEGRCGWCQSKIRAGKTIGEIQAIFVENEPVKRGLVGRKKPLNPVLTLADAAKLSAKLDAEIPAVNALAKAKAAEPKPLYPIFKMVPSYICSDGNEFTKEVDALRHELALCHSILIDRR